MKIYLDDIRTPKDPTWIVCRDYDQFVNKVSEIGLENITGISLDHDLGDTAMEEYYNNVEPHNILNYNNIKEKTGLDCVKWLIDLSMETDIPLPYTTVHSANPIGAHNMMGYINNYLKHNFLPQTCIRINIPHTVEN